VELIALLYLALLLWDAPVVLMRFVLAILLMVSNIWGSLFFFMFSFSFSLFLLNKLIVPS